MLEDDWRIELLNVLSKCINSLVNYFAPWMAFRESNLTLLVGSLLSSSVQMRPSPYSDMINVWVKALQILYCHYVHFPGFSLISKTQPSFLFELQLPTFSASMSRNFQKVLAYMEGTRLESTDIEMTCAICICNSLTSSLEITSKPSNMQVGIFNLHFNLNFVLPPFIYWSTCYNK